MCRSTRTPGAGDPAWARPDSPARSEYCLERELDDPRRAVRTVRAEVGVDLPAAGLNCAVVNGPENCVWFHSAVRNWMKRDSEKSRKRLEAAISQLLIRLTDFGLRTAVFCPRAWAHMFRRGLGMVLPSTSPVPNPVLRAFSNLTSQINAWVDHAYLAA